MENLCHSCDSFVSLLGRVDRLISISQIPLANVEVVIVTSQIPHT